MDAFTNLVVAAGDNIWYITFVILIGVGVYLTIRTRGVQVRSLPEMFRILGDPPGVNPDGTKGISSFRAFTVSAASRVGTANIAGVALAISLGGPGSVFWMWVVAAVGGASAFVESTLGQLYKVRSGDTYVGGPAYYMERGLKKRWMGLLFAVIITVTYGFVFNSVQSNSIVDAVGSSLGVSFADGEAVGLRVALGLGLVALTAAVIFGGIRSISAVTQVLVPVMAILYLFLGLLVVFMNLGEIPHMLGMIFRGAFGIEEFVSGTLFGVILQGLRRGLFSNEAGMGSAPNAGATASVSHPAKQGFIQSLGVYFDTWLICSITAFIVLLSDPVFGDKAKGSSLTQSALAAQLGDWAVHFLTVAIFLFAFSSVIGNYYYGESNIRFLTKSRAVMNGFRVLVLVCVFLGAMASLTLVWSLADLFMAVMAVLNLIAILMLAGVAAKVLRNYEQQRKEGKEPIFNAYDLPEIEGLDAWDSTDPVTTSQFWIDLDAEKAAKRKQR